MRKESGVSLKLPSGVLLFFFILPPTPPPTQNECLIEGKLSLLFKNGSLGEEGVII